MTLIDPSSEPVIRFLEANHFGKELQPLRLEGSERRYFRCHSNNASAVLCIENPFIAENHDFLNIRESLVRASVPVPEIIATSPEHGLILQSDAGSMDLQTWMDSDDSGDTADSHNSGPSGSWKAEAKAQRIEQHYMKLVDYILTMQSIPLEPPVSTRSFDREKLHWEMEFLYERLERVAHEKGVSVIPSFELKMFLLEVCEALGTYSSQCFVHRDYHSRNVMLHDQNLTIIDFQDARSGNRYYDLASLLFDPYVSIPVHLRKKCVDHYFASAGLEKGRGIFYLQGLQRILKAMGSYLYLGLELGKTSYLDCIEGSLNQLEACLHLGRFPDSVFLFILDCKKKLVPALQ
ncbi:MAG TPA: hypothetical protein DEA96_09825 [Leptospiraceae bacterium]|nr:hypothetical protein [Spirochaetaceae bacterium]HBS05253.1 hypothetical protein [Leptospiraceae bacterium]|tara:strand:- start:82165 stop:83211 length:1047 start_codon:yes stop_codon:yes gene_type:complete